MPSNCRTRGKGNDNSGGKGKGGKKSSYEGQYDDGVGEGKALTASDADPQLLAYRGSDLPLYAAKGGNGKGKGGSDKGKSGNDKGKGNGNGNAKGKPDETGWKNALQRGNGKKWGLYKKLGLVDGPFEHMTGQMENILAVIDQIVNGEVNLPPGEHEELFKLVREVGKGYTILGTTWDYNERNEIIRMTNEIRMEEYDFRHDDAGNMTTDGRSVYQWNAKGQLEKVTFPDGFGQQYEYDAKGRRTKTIQFNHQGSIQWVINYHYKGNTWQITHETDQDGNIIMEYTYDEQSRPLSVTYKGETFWYVYNGHGDVVALTDKNGEIAARYEYDEWGVVTRMYNRFGERVREGIGWIGDLNTGNGAPGSRLGPIDDNDDYDFHPGNGRGKAKGWEKNGEGPGSGDEEIFIQSTDPSTLDESVILNTVDTTFDKQTTDEQTVTFDVYEAGTLSGDDEEVTEDITTDLVKENPFRYAGYYWDRKTQFYYLQARYYNPRLGRFLSMDPWRGEVTNPLSLNRYVYSLNNPVNYWDPTGKNAESLRQILKEANIYIPATQISEMSRLQKRIGFYEGNETGIYTSDLYYGVMAYQMWVNYWNGGTLVGLSTVEPLPESGLIDNRTLTSARRDANLGRSLDYKFPKVMITGDIIIGTLAGEALIEGAVVTVVTVARFVKSGAKLIKNFVKTKKTGKTGTVWDSINPTQPAIPNTTIPKSFEISVGNNSFWVHPNATKHMAEYSTRTLSHGTKMTDQMLLTSFNNAIEQAVKQGIRYEEMMKVGNWELIFSKPKTNRQLPVIKHALYTP